MNKTFTRDRSYAAKGLAILLMLMYHLFETGELVTSMQVNYSPFSLDDFLTLSGFGNVCVSVFVFLTAFGISAGLFEKEEFSFPEAYRQAAKRFARLAVNFFILYLSVNILWWYKFDYQSLYGINKQGVLFMLTDAFGLSMFFQTPTLNMTWWYMEIAYVLIFLVPLLAWIVKKIGNYALLPAFFAPAVLSVQPDIKRYLFVAVFGVCAAYGHWPDRLLNLRIPAAVQWIIGIAGLALCVLVRQNFVVHEYYLDLADAPIALFVIYVGAVLIGSLPAVGKAFVFVGKHSMNIYLVHTFFYMALWQKFIYQFRYAAVDFVMLLVCSLLYSVALELFKRLICLRKLEEKLHLFQK